MEIKNFDYCQEAITLKKQTEVNFLMLGQYLYNIREKEMYQGQWSSFPEFLDDMNLPEGTASKLVNIYKKFVLEFKIREQILVNAGGWTKLAALLPVVNTKAEAQEWLLKSAALSIRDLGFEIKEAKTGVEMRKCAHKNSYLVRICRDCGFRHEEHDTSRK